MFSKAILVYFLSVWVVLSEALPPSRRTTASQCNAASLWCCNTVTNAENPSVGQLLGLLGVPVPGLVPGTLIGLGCTPITVIGLAQGINCAQQPVCCDGVNYNGLIVTDCIPVSIS